MSESRREVMAGIRRALGVTGAERPRQDAVASRLAQTPLGVIPARGQLTEADRVALFRHQAEKAHATVCIVGSPDLVPDEVARFLRELNLPATLRRGTDRRLAALPWERTALTLAIGPSEGADLNAISFALGGVAESGTLVLTSGPDNPTSLNFLPDTHVVVVHAAEIAGDLESVLRRLPGAGALPRSVNLITGPSRSGDIEQTLILGAHGPRRLHIVVIDADAVS